MMKKALLGALVAAFAIAPLGCSKDETPAECSAENTMDGDCIGVPLESLCGEDATSTGGQCNNVFVVGSQGELDAAVGSATAGDCIALSPGSYASATLPDGVSLFGRHPNEVKMEGVLAGGTDVRVRGIEFGSGGVGIMSGSAVIEAVRVTNAADNGVTVFSSATASIEHSEITGAARYGVSAFEAVGVTMSFSKVTAGGGPGLWAACTAADAPTGVTGCDCVEPVLVQLSSTKIDGNKTIGLALNGAQATLANVSVNDTQVGSNFQYGGGVAAFGCSDISASGLELDSNTDYGMLVDDSRLYVDGVAASGNLRGIWVQNIGQSMAGGATLMNGTLDGNLGVGLGIGEGSLDVLLEGLEVTGTVVKSMPIVVGNVSASQADVGDGVAWKAGAQATLRGLTMSGNGRASIIIDGDVNAGSAILGVTFSGGDEQQPIIQQNTSPTPVSPALDAGLTIEPTSEQLFKVPNDLIPPGI